MGDCRGGANTIASVIAACYVETMRRKRSSKSRMHFVLGQDLQSDGHTRITRGEQYLVQGGTETSHRETVDIVETFSKKLDQEGQPDLKEAVKILKDVLKKKGYAPKAQPDTGGS
jgi:hypothetical protein